jgi:hypothetical protein
MLRLQKIFNVMQDPFERADITSNTCWDWFIDRAGIVYGMMDLEPDDRGAHRTARRLGSPVSDPGGRPALNAGNAGRYGPLAGFGSPSIRKAERRVLPATGGTALPRRPTSPYIPPSRQQPKGGDPVSHCHTPWSPVVPTWILASAEVRA